MQLDELYQNVQKPVGVVQKWSVQMYWTRALAANCSSLDKKGCFRTRTGTGGKDSRLVRLWDQTRVWDPGD